MKLLTLANRYYLVTLILVFVIEGFAAYFVLKSIINKEFNQKLFAEKEQLIQELHTYAELRKTYYLNIGDKIVLEEVDVDPEIPPTLSDTVMFDYYEQKELPYRTLTFSDQFKGKYYVITITKSLLSNQDLIEGIGEIFLGTVAVLVFSLIYLNGIISKRIWTPFYRLLDQLRKFNLTKPEFIELGKSQIDEFAELNKVLEGLIKKTLKDYKNLKEYTENTSHEIQTPLAIIKNKSETLLQEDLPEQQLKQVASIYEAADRLSRLKEGLSTLSKIENNQFIDTEPINIKTFLIKKIGHFDELIQLKNLKLTTTFHAEPIIILNNSLAYILITNLISNAIKHNLEGGEIHVILKENELTIHNTGENPKLPTDQLFDRFKKSSTHGESTGLGLALVKRIIDLYHMKITYSYSNGWHKLIVNF